MKVLLTGADGYIGVIMGPKLIEAGHEVVGLDTGFYRRGWLYDDHRTRPKVVTRDVRRLEVADLAGFDAVVHLAELSNDPLGENDPGLTMEINHQGSLGLAEKARAAGVRRFVYASSCSTYGAGGDELRTETSALAPQTAYAQCKNPGGARRGRADRRALRPGLPAQRHRLRRQPAAALRHRPEQPRRLRPHHSRDPHDLGRLALAADRACGGHLPGHALRADRPARGGGGRGLQRRRGFGNYRIREIAEIVARTFPGCELTIGSSGGDTRSYRVSFAKIRAHMPDFATAWSAERGARQLKAVFDRIGLTRAMFEAEPFTRLKELKHLRATGQLDERLHWRAPEPV